MRMSEKCHNNSSDNSLISRRADGDKKGDLLLEFVVDLC